MCSVRHRSFLNTKKTAIKCFAFKNLVFYERGIYECSSLVLEKGGANTKAYKKAI